MSTSKPGPRKIIPIVASAETQEIDSAIAADPVMVSLYEAHKKIYPRSVSGLFSN